MKLIQEILTGDITALGQGITLIESTLPEDEKKAKNLLEECLPKSGNSIRIGITGVPGVGKSTLIEALGSYLIEEKKKGDSPWSTHKPPMIQARSVCLVSIQRHIAVTLMMWKLTSKTPMNLSTRFMES